MARLEDALRAERARAEGLERKLWLLAPKGSGAGARGAEAARRGDREGAAGGGRGERGEERDEKDLMLAAMVKENDRLWKVQSGPPAPTPLLLPYQTDTSRPNPRTNRTRPTPLLLPAPSGGAPDSPRLDARRKNFSHRWYSL